MSKGNEQSPWGAGQGRGAGSGLWRTDSAGVVIALALTAAVGFGVLRPIFIQRAQGSTARSDLGTQLAKVEVLRGQKRDLETRLAQARQDMAAQPVHPEPLDRLNQRLARLAQLAAAEGLAFEQVSPSPAVNGLRYTAVPIKTSGRGSFKSCVGFLASLKSHCPDTTVVGLRASANPDEPETAASFSFDLVWYAAQPAKPGAK